MRYRLQSLRGKKEFSLIWRIGRKIESDSFRMHYRKNSSPYTRAAVVVPKAVDKRATRRNLLRRRAREWIRKNYGEILRDPYDIVLTFKKQAKEKERSKFYEELARLFSMLKGK